MSLMTHLQLLRGMMIHVAPQGHDDPCYASHMTSPYEVLLLTMRLLPPPMKLSIALDSSPQDLNVLPLILPPHGVPPAGPAAQQRNAASLQSAAQQHGLATADAPVGAAGGLTLCLWDTVNCHFNTRE